MDLYDTITLVITVMKLYTIKRTRRGQEMREGMHPISRISRKEFRLRSHKDTQKRDETVPAPTLAHASWTQTDEPISIDKGITEQRMQQ